MVKKSRIHYEDAFYHVIIRGNNKAYVFNEDPDKIDYINRVIKYINMYIHNFILMG